MTRIRVVAHPQPPVAQGPTQAVRPLTHHEILALMAPFTRRGRHADLAASRRAERRLVFRPIHHAMSVDGLPALREVLTLEVSERGNFRLIRTLTAEPDTADEPDLTAELSAAGSEPEILLEEIERIPVERHFAVRSGALLARSYKLKPGPRHAVRPWHITLTEARAKVHDVVLELDADDRDPVQLRVSAAAGERLVIPEDLVAVLGWRWRPLEEYSSHWRGSIRVAVREPARTAELEDKLGRTIDHLVATLAGPPRHFHTRHRAQRWRVAFQRALPLLIALGVIAATPAVRLLPITEGSLMRMLIFHAPPLMLIGFFMMRELPRIEIPPLPRNLNNDRWFTPRS